jgi:hypothetical protein
MNVMNLYFAFFVCLCPLGGPLQAQEAKLHALDHYAGVWDCQFSISTQQETNEPSTFTGVVEGKWVVGDKFMEQTGSYRLNDTSAPVIIRTMMSYDENKQRYQYDYFNSSGDIQRSFGQWDDSKKTMTSTMTDVSGGNIVSIVADFSTIGTEHWTIESRDPNGKLIMKIEGTNTKRAHK